MKNEEDVKIDEELKTFLDLISPEEIEEYHRLKKKMEAAASGRAGQNEIPIDEAAYYYGDTHPEFVTEGITHLFINVKSELHHMNDECTELTNIQQINSVDYHVVVKPGIDPVNLSKDFIETLDKSLDASYVNIEKELEKKKANEA